MEDTGNQGLGGTRSFIARQVGVYESIFSEHGFEMSECTYLNTRVSYLGWAVVSEIFLSKNHKEGEPIGVVPQIILSVFLPVGRILDDFFVEKKGLTKMIFRRMSIQPH
jgi:hypothetical protein